VLLLYIACIQWQQMLMSESGPPGANLVKESSWIDPDFPARVLSFFGIIKNFDPSSFSHVTHLFVNKL